MDLYFVTLLVLPFQERGEKKTKKENKEMIGWNHFDTTCTRWVIKKCNHWMGAIFNKNKKNLEQIMSFGQKCFLCHSIKISISLEHLNQSSPFFLHCKGKFMTNLEIDIICSRFFLFLKYSSHPVIAFFMTHPVYACASLHAEPVTPCQFIYVLIVMPTIVCNLKQCFKFRQKIAGG